MVAEVSADKTVVSATDSPRRIGAVAAVGFVLGTIVIASMVARPVAGEETPWERFVEAVPGVDSVGGALWIVFFGTILTVMNFGALVASLGLRWIFPTTVLAIVVLAVLSPAVRASWLVRTGAGVVALGVVPLLIAGLFNDNPLGFGFLFVFLAPIGGVLILGGVMFALLAGGRTAGDPKAGD
jgi:hypothetical protein